MSAASANLSARAPISPASALLAALRRVLASAVSACGIGHEMEAVQMTDMLTLDGNVAGGRDFRFEHRFLSQAPHENARPLVNEALGETFMERVR